MIIFTIFIIINIITDRRFYLTLKRYTNMKKYLVAIIMVMVVAGSSFAAVENLPKAKVGGGKHASHKKAKKKKSAYMFNFQH